LQQFSVRPSIVAVFRYENQFPKIKKFATEGFFLSRSPPQPLNGFASLKVGISDSLGREKCFSPSVEQGEASSAVVLPMNARRNSATHKNPHPDSSCNSESRQRHSCLSAHFSHLLTQTKRLSTDAKRMIFIIMHQLSVSATTRG
jgi:hypothetical protein